MPLASWTSRATFRHIAMRDDIRVLGIRFGKTVAITAQLSWGATVRAVRAVACQTYHRQLSLEQRIYFVRCFLLAKIWYVAQILLPSIVDVRRLQAIASWYIWNGAIFRVPMTTLQLPKRAGGWGMDEIGIKCKALLYGRMMRLGMETFTCTSLLMRYWKIDRPSANPPPATRLPSSLPHCRHYALDLAYLPQCGTTESFRTFQERLKITLLTLERNAKPLPEMRIARHFPDVAWSAVWENLHSLQLQGPIVSD